MRHKIHHEIQKNGVALCRRVYPICQQLLIAIPNGGSRNKAEAGQLPTIAPKRFNPEGKTWLPVLHSTQDGWHFTALYSNTARAHELGRTHDWVVVYFYDDHHRPGQG